MSENVYAMMPYEDYTATCNAIRNKTGTNSLIKSGDMAGMIEGIEGGGNTEIEDAMVIRSLSTYTNNRTTIVGNGAFVWCSSLTSVNFPVCTTISDYAFGYCPSLTAVSFPKCTTIDRYAFYNCDSLVSVNFPECTKVSDVAFCECPSLTQISFPKCSTIGAETFRSCYSLTTINFPTCTRIGSEAFRNCTSLTSVSFPACTAIRDYAFAECTSLTMINFPECLNIDIAAFEKCTSLISANLAKCQYIPAKIFHNCRSLTSINFPACIDIGMSAFVNCNSLTSVSFPACINIGMDAFMNCTSLKWVSFPACTAIRINAFYNCYNLISFYLVGSSVCELINSNAFSLTPIGGYSSIAKYSGAIYVPASLLTSYKTATNWTYFSDKIYAFENGDVDTSIPIIMTKFTISGIEYQADENMTWGQWCESDYNTDGYYVGYDFSNEILSDNAYPVKMNGNYIYADDVIAMNGSYEADSSDQYPV